MSSPRSEFLSGLKAELPIALSVIPFGMIYGVLALDAGLPASATQAMSAIIFAGSSQFISTQLFSQSAPGLIIVISVGVVNLRHLLYSASIAPYVQRLPVHWKMLLAYLLTDEAYAVSITRYNQPDDIRDKHWFFLACGSMLWVTWQLSTAAGIFLGTTIPASWSLDFTLALTFIALVVPALKNRPSLGAAVVAGGIAIATAGFPYKLGILAAALAGILAGLWLEKRA